jgi:hypothetical protein
MSQSRTIKWTRHFVWREDRIRVYMVLLRLKRRGTFEGEIFKLTLMREREEDSSGSEWRTVLHLVKRMTDFQSPQNARNSLTTDIILASQKGLCAMELVRRVVKENASRSDYTVLKDTMITSLKEAITT